MSRPPCTLMTRYGGIDLNKTSMVRLPDDARHDLLQRTTSGQAAASQILPAPRWLHVDAHAPHWAEAPVATTWPWQATTVRRVRQRFGAPGRAAALVHTQPVQPSRPCRLAGAQAAPVLAWRCGPPPWGVATFVSSRRL
jgi:hypothetical protein